MKKVLISLAAAVVFAAVAAPGIADAHPTPAPPAGPVTVASGLHNPRQIAVGPLGTLAVAEAGSGNVGASVAGACFDGPEGPACIGNTGSDGNRRTRNPFRLPVPPVQRAAVGRRP